MLSLAVHAAVSTNSYATRPNLIMVVSDDHGWHNIGIRNVNMSTPYMDEMITKEGVLLSRHYVFKFCSPSRSSVMSGRLPIHVNQENSATVQPWAGVMANFTMFPERLKEAGYATAQVGKWHCGQAAPAHVPHGRGFDTSLGFFNFGCDHYTQIRGSNARRRLSERDRAPPMCKGVDLWKTDKPAYGLNGTYSGTTFSNEVQRVIGGHDTSVPLFMYIAWQNNHAPLEVPEEFENKCNPSLPKNTRVYCGMTAFLDEAMGNMTSTLKNRGMWNTTLVVFSADNGGWPSQAGDNYPLIGGKFADLEGGTRVLAFATGGLLPQSVRGTTNTGYMHIADWSVTFMTLAGIANPLRDDRAAAANFPPVDGLDLWPLLSGTNATSPRTEIPLSANPPASLYGGGGLVDSQGAGTEGFRRGWYAQDFGEAGYGYFVGGEGLIVGDFKLVTGLQHTGPFGNASYRDCGAGCVFNIIDDPTESKDLAQTNPSKLKELQNRQEYWRSTVFAPERGPMEQAACDFLKQSGGFFGPWLTKPEPYPGPIGRWGR